MTDHPRHESRPMTDPLTPERLAELRRIATGEDWSPPQPEDVAALIGEIDRLAPLLAHAHERTEAAEAAHDGLEAALKIERERTGSAERLLMKAMDDLDAAAKRYHLEHERAETLEAENAQLHRQLGVLNSRPDVRQLVATLQRLVAQPTTADAYGDMLAQSIRHVVGRIALGVGVQDAQRGPQRAVAASVMDFPSEAASVAQRAAEGVEPAPLSAPCGHPPYWLVLGDGGVGCMVCGPAKAEEIAPEGEGISSADAQAQIESDRYMDATMDCPDCDAYGRTRDDDGALTAQPCPRCKGTGRVPDARNDVLKPEEWCDRYGIRILDPDGWRRADAPDWNERITLDVFHRLLASSTSDAARGGYQRIVADLRDPADGENDR